MHRRTNPGCPLIALVALFVMACGILLSNATTAAEADVVVGPDFSREALTGHLSMLRDPGHRLGLEDVAFGAEQDRFRPVPGPVALGYTPDAVWFRTTLRRNGSWPAELFLWLQPNFLDSVRVYVPRTGDPSSAADFDMTELGDHALSEERIFFPPFQAMKLVPPDAETFDIFLRVETTSSLTVRATFSTLSSLSRSAANYSFTLGAIVAFLVALGLLQFYNWTRLRKPVFFWFSGFLIWLAVTIYSLGGFDVVGDNRLLGVFASDYVAFLALLMLHFFGLGFLLAQTDAKTQTPWLFWTGRAVMGLTLASIVATLFGHYTAVIVPNMVVIMALLAVFAAVNVRLALKAKVGRTVSAIACLVYAAVIIPYDAALMGVVTLPPPAMNLNVFGGVFFIALMTISLMQRATALDRLQRESEELRVARRAERAATDLVRVRTEELVVAKNAAETALEHERAAQREQVRFVDVVTHQYRTPLAVIRSSVTALRHGLASNDEANRKRIRQIETAVRRLVEIMDVSLDRSRMEGHAAKADRRSVPVIATVTDALTRSRDLLPGRTILSSFHRIEEADHASLDPDMLAIALSNLIDNATKFSEPDRPVSVRVARDGKNLSIEVEDEGIGIPPHEVEKVSERYFRASNAGSVVGTGLGLNIVRQIASAHEGRFGIETRKEKGVVARISFPAF